MFIRLLLVAIACTISFELSHARTVCESEARIAAEALLRESLLAKHFPNHTISAVENVNQLWLIRLTPSGHLLLSSSTRLTPLLAFSTSEFQAYPEGHPRMAILNATQNAVTAAEMQIFSTSATETPTSAELRWDALLNPTHPTLFSTSTSKTVGPLLKTTWGQNAPYNDFCPQCLSETDDASLRAGRTPAGCVATMYAQVLQYHAWPYRLDTSFSAELNATSCAVEGPHHYFFDNALPIAWEDLASFYTGTNEMESSRLPIARAFLFVDMLAKMSFNPDASAAVSHTPTQNNYYVAGVSFSKEATAPFTTEQRSQIMASLDAGCPIPTTIPGHAIVVDGYQTSDSGDFYLHLNYGWSGLSDDFWNIGESYDSVNITYMLLNHHPKPTVQIDPLPTHVNDKCTLKWHLPKYWADKISGFTLTVATQDENSTSTWSEPCNVIRDAEANGDVYTIASKQINEHTLPALCVRSTSSTTGETYLCPESFVPTTTSFMTLQTRAKYTIRHALEVQINVAGNAWQTLYTIPGNDEDEQPEWQENTISLADYAGKNCQIRLKTYRSAPGWVYGLDSEFALTQWQISDVLGGTTLVETLAFSPDTREATITTLTPNKSYLFTLTPHFNQTDIISKSASVATDSGKQITLPQITSVTNTQNHALTDNTLRQGTLSGKTILRVTCNETTTALRVTSGNHTLLPPSAIQIYPYDRTIFDIVLTTNFNVPALDGARILLTLSAEDAYGNTASRNLVLALRATIYDETYTPPIVEWETVTGEHLQIPYYWFREYNLATTTSSANDYLSATQSDTDADGFQAWEEWLCETSPTNATDKLSITALEFTPSGQLSAIHHTPQSSTRATFHIQGKTNLSDTWSDANLSTHRFFRLQANPKQ